MKMDVKPITAEGTLPALVAGVLTGVVVLLGALSQAAFLFSGPLEAGLPMAVGAALFAAAVGAIALAWGSSLPGMIGFPQGVPLAILAVIAGGVSARMAGQATGPEITVTALAAIGLATAFGGVVLFLLGHFRLGGLIRFIPFPVIAAFLAGSGWLIAKGSVDLIAGESLAELADAFGLAKLVLALGFVALLSFLSQRTHASLALSLAVIAATGGFQIAVYALDLDPDTLTATGWLMAPSTDLSLWPPIGPEAFSLIDWQVILHEWASILSLPALAALALLMNASGLELALRRDIDLDRELRVAGIGNVLGGLGGGGMGYQDLGLSLLSHRMGGAARLTGLVAAFPALLALAFGGPMLGLVPKPLFGALLLWIGANLLLDWAVLTQRQLRNRDYALLLGVLGVIVAFGPLYGIGAGLLVALVLFAVDYARVDIVRARIDGTCFRSSVERSEQARQTLDKKGRQILVYRLQGFVFFATAARLREELAERLEQGSEAVRYVLLDFAAVTGFDSSTVMTLVRFERLALAHGFTLVLTGLKQDALDHLTRGGLTYGEGEPCHVLGDLDRGMEWCEDRLLASGPRRAKTVELREELQSFFGNREDAAAFIAYLEPMEFAPGEMIVARNSKANEIYFFESGHARVEAEPEELTQRRLRGFGPGSLLGELAFFTGQKRAATICATEPVKLWRFTRKALERMEQEAPALTSSFYRALSRQLAGRLAGTNRMLRYLVD